MKCEAENRGADQKSVYEKNQTLEPGILCLSATAQAGDRRFHLRRVGVPPYSFHDT